MDRRTDRHNEGNRRFSQFCEKRLERPLGEVYFKNQKYPLNAYCDLNAQLLDDEAGGTDNYHRTKRSC
jgi:hypothetical protein